MLTKFHDLKRTGETRTFETIDGATITGRVVEHPSSQLGGNTVIRDTSDVNHYIAVSYIVGITTPTGLVSRCP